MGGRGCKHINQTWDCHYQEYVGAKTFSLGFHSSPPRLTTSLGTAQHFFLYCQ